MLKKSIKIFSGLAIITFISLDLLEVKTFDALSYATTIAGLSAVLYDRILWRYNPFDKTPRLFGVYDSECLSTHDNGTLYKSIIVIRQTLSTISIVETIDNTCNESITATLHRHTPDGPWFLYFTYLTHPMPSSSDDMHYGSAILYVRNSGLLEGTYFTNRKEQTAGAMVLKKIDS